MLIIIIIMDNYINMNINININMIIHYLLLFYYWGLLLLEKFCWVNDFDHEILIYFKKNNFDHIEYINKYK